MSRRISRISLALVIFLTSEVWALGLGDIRLESALNEPLRADIELLAASPEELDNLTVALASAVTFQRYGLDRPFFLQDIQFTIVRSGRADGNVVQLRTSAPVAEPFLTFLVEATWSRGRLLREYTVLLDPPTFAPPAADSMPAVQAPSRTTPADSGQIQRPAPATPQRPAPAPATPPQRQPRAESPKPQPPAEETPYDTTTGNEFVVRPHDTLWGIAASVRPDSRLTMNQTMLAIFRANPEAFGGNINILRAGATLRIPSADEIYRIDRAGALAEAQRQNAAWSGGAAPGAGAGSRPSLTLVPPDEDYAAESAPPETGYEEETGTAEPAPQTREEEILDRLAEIEAAGVPDQQSLIEIRNNELATLREELARIRGEEYVPESGAGEEETEPFADIKVDETPEEPAAGEPETAASGEPAEAEETPPPSTVIQTSRRAQKPSLVERTMELLTQWWMVIVGVVVAVALVLFWFMRRGPGDDEVDAWQPLDADEMEDDLSATETMHAPAGDESFVVVEQESAKRPPAIEDTVEAPAPEVEADETGQFGSLEDTFSSETAINLDQTDPIAEADFHMAYGLYDQAADLINGALEVEPTRSDLLTKLCEIYFVWGNRDAFVDAAGRLQSAVAGTESEEWDKIVIMGQQIAGDDPLFSGVSPAGAPKSVDLAFDGDMHETGALDMELIADSEASDDVVDLGSGDSDDTAAVPAVTDDVVDFFVDLDETAESPTIESPGTDVTRELPAASDETAEIPVQGSTSETATVEQPREAPGGTAELPALDVSARRPAEASDETAEINLDDLDLDLDGMAETELASLDDLDATGEMEAMEDTGVNESIEDTGAVTGRNPEIDPDATGAGSKPGANDTGINESLDDSLLDATGLTQVLGSDQAVDTSTDVNLGDDDATMLAPGYGDDSDIKDDQDTLLASLDDDEGGEDFDFAKTEALPKEAFGEDRSADETGELPAIASTDVDLDLDDLTAALKVSDAAGDTVEQVRDDATVEQPRPGAASDDDAETMALSEDDMSDDLHDARTMTEVGTKLDLARAYMDMGDPGGARSILQEVLDEGDESQRQQAKQLLDSLPG